MKHYVFIESNTTGTGRLAVERLVREGHQVTFVTRTPAKYPFLSTPPANLRVVEAETNDQAQLEAVLDRLAAEGPPTAVLSFSTYYIESAARLARRLGLRSIDPEAARQCHHKFLGRQALRRAGAPTPPFWLVGTQEEVDALKGSVTFPCVVKPPSDSGSIGVRRVDSFEALRDQVAALAQRATNDRGQALDGRVLVEGYLRGPEFSVEVFTLARGQHHVFGVTQKHLSPEPHFVEVGHDFPAPLPEAQRRALVTATTQGLDAVGLDFGFSHTEARLTDAGAVIIEINPRLAGGMIPELVGYSTGLDVLGLMFAGLEGTPAQLEPLRSDVASIRFLLAEQRGTLQGVDGLEAARAVPGIKLIEVDKKLGSSVRPPESSSDRIGYVIAAGRERADVERALAEARRQLRLRIAP
ncbi:MAG: ATP-grasp domain-containing protein [Myxococcaceae bacterium]|nr:ATP-grasp domain-containing protein [Myxococcaceae bacterium]